MGPLRGAFGAVAIWPPSLGHKQSGFPRIAGHGNGRQPGKHGRQPERRPGRVSTLPARLNTASSSNRTGAHGGNGNAGSSPAGAAIDCHGSHGGLAMTIIGRRRTQWPRRSVTTATADCGGSIFGDPAGLRYPSRVRLRAEPDRRPPTGSAATRTSSLAQVGSRTTNGLLCRQRMAINDRRYKEEVVL